MDEVDQANGYAAADLQFNIAHVAGQLHAGAGTLYCVECGEPIPAARRRAYPAATRCIDCAQKAEN